MSEKLGKLLEEEETVEMIREDLYLIRSPKVPSSNSLVILDNENILIDTGSDREILKEISSEIDSVLISHYHFDHIKNNQLFKNVKINNMEAPAIKSPENYLKMCGVSDPEIKEKMKKQLQETPQFQNIWREKIQTYSENQTINQNNTKWKIIHTPGHSPGHCCFLEKNTNTLYAGDYSPEEFGPWYGWPSCDLTYLIRSIKKIIGLEPDCLLSSHSEPVRENIESVMMDYLDVVRERDRKISKLQNEGKSVEDMVGEGIIYNDEAGLEPIDMFFEMTMISKHLEIDVGKVLEE